MKREKNRHKKEKLLRPIFDKIDTDGSGKIKKNELREFWIAMVRDDTMLAVIENPFL